MPSVRGRERLVTASILVASGGIGGALVGLIVAVIAAPLSGVSDDGVLSIVAAGLLFDGTQLVMGSPRPPTSGRQVPREWSRLFSPPVVAMLYGARMGVGPLTILSTWTWWSVTIAAALIDPATSVIVGGGFGLVRLTVTVAASRLAETARPNRLRARRRSSWVALNGAGLVLLAVFVLIDLGAGRQPDVTATPAEPARTRAQATTAGTTPPGPPPGPARTDDRPPIIPVELEDIVRTTIPTANAGAVIGEAGADRQTRPAAVSSDPEALSAALISAMDGFSPVDDPRADRYLDIVAAAEIQPDPSEETALLETRGFEGGWTRAFRNENNDVAVASVYQFEDPAEAEFYLEDGLITIGGYGGKFFDIDELPGVRGFVQHFTDGGRVDGEELVSLGAAFRTGPRWYLVYFVGSTSTVTSDMLISAVTAQRLIR